MVMLNYLMPDKMKAAFSVGVDSCEEDDAPYGEGYLNSVFLVGATISPSNVTAVS